MNNAIVAIQPIDYPYIVVKEFASAKDLLNYLVNDLELYGPDYDYEPDEEYEADLDVVIQDLEEEFVGDGSFGIANITIMIDGKTVFEG